MAVLRTFRRYNKALLAVFTAVLMVSFLIGDTLRSCSHGGASLDAGEVLGRKISATDRVAARSRWMHMYAVYSAALRQHYARKLDTARTKDPVPLLQAAFQAWRPCERLEQEVLARQQNLGLMVRFGAVRQVEDDLELGTARVFIGSGREFEPTADETMLRLGKIAAARKAGVTITDREVDDYVDQLGLKRDDLQKVANNVLRVKFDDLRETIREELFVLAQMSAVLSSVQVTEPQLLQFLRDHVDRLSLNVAEVSARDFVADYVPAPDDAKATEELKKLYEKHKDAIGRRPSGGNPLHGQFSRQQPGVRGYKLPDRAEFEVLRISNEDVSRLSDLAKGRIAKLNAADKADLEARAFEYWKAHRNDFPPPAPPPEPTKSDPKTDPKADPKTEPKDKTGKDKTEKTGLEPKTKDSKKPGDEGPQKEEKKAEPAKKPEPGEVKKEAPGEVKKEAPDGKKDAPKKAEKPLSAGKLTVGGDIVTDAATFVLAAAADDKKPEEKKPEAKVEVKAGEKKPDAKVEDKPAVKKDDGKPDEKKADEKKPDGKKDEKKDDVKKDEKKAEPKDDRSQAEKEAEAKEREEFAKVKDAVMVRVMSESLLHRQAAEQLAPAYRSAVAKAGGDAAKVPDYPAGLHPLLENPAGWGLLKLFDNRSIIRRPLTELGVRDGLQQEFRVEAEYLRTGLVSLDQLYEPFQSQLVTGVASAQSTPTKKEDRKLSVGELIYKTPRLAAARKERDRKARETEKNAPPPEEEKDEPGALTAGALAPVLRDIGGNVFLVRMLAAVPEHTPKFEDVRDAVAEDYALDKAYAELAGADGTPGRAAKLAEAIAKGGEKALPKGVRVQRTDPFELKEHFDLDRAVRDSRPAVEAMSRMKATEPSMRRQMQADLQNLAGALTRRSEDELLLGWKVWLSRDQSLPVVITGDGSPSSGGSPLAAQFGMGRSYGDLVGFVGDPEAAGDLVRRAYKMLAENPGQVGVIPVPKDHRVLLFSLRDYQPAKGDRGRRDNWAAAARALAVQRVIRDYGNKAKLTELFGYRTAEPTE